MRLILLVLGGLVSGCVTLDVGPGHVLHPRRDAEAGGLALDAAAVADAVRARRSSRSPSKRPTA